MADPDWDDPCAVLEWLKPQYYQIMAGGAITVIRHGDEWTHYGASNQADLIALKLQLEAECAKKKGIRLRRAITAG